MQFDPATLKRVGADVIVSPMVSITRPELVSLGNHVAIDPWLHCTTALETNDYVHISSHVSIIGGKHGKLVMGNCTNISTGGRIICGSDEFKGAGIVSAPGLPEEFRDRLIVEPVILENFVNLGASVTILPGAHLPEGVVIGACSLVRKSDVLAPWTIYAGNPLRKLQQRPRDTMLAYAKRLDL